MVFAALVVAGSLLGIAAVAAIPSLRSTVLESQALLNRLNIFYQAAHLVRDYLFTGCGLGNFPLVHSTYVLLIHVPEMVFAHSTPLDVAVEQGMLGALALVVIWAGAAWVGMRRLAYSERWTAGLGAGLLSLAVLMLHGAVDSTIYGSRALLLFWMPVALILAASESPGDGAREVETDGAELPESPAGRPGQGQAEERAGPLGSGALAQWAAVGAAVLLFVGLLALLWRPLAASWYANLGAVHQTLVELRTYDYHHFDDPTLDEVRRRADLTRAVRAFERAVALDPGQVTARTRLAQIALARGEYESALEHAVAAWQAGYRDRVTRLVLADALVAQGRPEEAATLVSGLEFARSRLQGQAFSRYQQSGDWQRAAYALRAVLALDPDDAQARQAAEAAEARAKGQ
jgi:tetratricopeptide (TPR) repeat protein